MPRTLGEHDIMLSHHRIGAVRVLNATPYSGAFPVFGLSLGVTVQKPTPELLKAGTVEALELRDLRGELRLSENGNAIGFAQPVGDWTPVAASGYESQLQVVVPLDPWRVTRIEAWRNGGAPRFYLHLWPTFTSGGSWPMCQVSAFPFEVPHLDLLNILSKWSPRAYHVLEVPVSEVDRERFALAVVHVTKANAHLESGRYDEAVGECRLAIDAMFNGLESTGKEDRFSAYLQPRIPEERADEYAKLLTALKDITHKPHHPSSAPHQHWRAEAVFAVQTTQHMLALVGSLTADRQAPGT